MVTHIDHLGHGNTLPVREVSKLREKTREEKEKIHFLVLLFEKGPYCAAQVVFELMILLLLPSGCWDYRPVLLFLAIGEMDLKTE